MRVEACKETDYPHDDVWCDSCFKDSQHIREIQALETVAKEYKYANDLASLRLEYETGEVLERERRKKFKPPQSTYTPPPPPSKPLIKGGMDVNPT